MDLNIMIRTQHLTNSDTLCITNNKQGIKNTRRGESSTDFANIPSNFS